MPTTIDELSGRINDCDSHETMSFPRWGEIFGDAAGDLAESLWDIAPLLTPAFDMREDTRDTAAITSESVWTDKGPAAPGAMDMRRRLEVMDVMGVNRQLVFPTTGILGLMLYSGFDFMGLLDPTRTGGHGVELRELGRAIVSGHNDWVMRNVKDLGPNRLRPVAILLVESFEQMMADAQAMLDADVRAIWLPPSFPPAGMSPGNDLLDPFWDLFEQANVPITLHAGSDFVFLDQAWTNAAALAPLPEHQSLEFPGVCPYSMATLKNAPENYITTMVMGGVFERHPNLRVGVIEATAAWVPSLVDRIGLWNQVLRGDIRGGLELTPTEYFARNVRVTPFVFEPVDKIIRANPALADVYCFSTDYPHPEGGRNSLQRFYDMVSPLGDDVIEKFFVTNADLLLPA